MKKMKDKLIKILKNPGYIFIALSRLGFFKKMNDEKKGSALIIQFHFIKTVYGQHGFLAYGIGELVVHDAAEEEHESLADVQENLDTPVLRRLRDSERAFEEIARFRHNLEEIQGNVDGRHNDGSDPLQVRHPAADKPFFDPAQQQIQISVTGEILRKPVMAIDGFETEQADGLVVF